MILEVDIGNTNIKWRVRQSDTVLLAGCKERGDAVNYFELFGSFEFVPTHIYLASVVAFESSNLQSWCQEFWGLSPFVAEVSRECAGVVNAYADVSQMGVDRWLAIVAAYQGAKSDCLVVSVGSACTVDLLLASGRHMGGYIVPGLDLMRRALFDGTDRVKLADIVYDSNITPGCSTGRAVSSGLQSMLLGLIVNALDHLVSVARAKPQVVIAGGGAEVLSSLFSGFLKDQNRMNHILGLEVRPDLVFEGLPWVCQV